MTKHREHPENATKVKKRRKAIVRLARAQLRAPAEEVAAWMAAAALQGRSLNSWLRQIANAAVGAP